MRLSLFLGIVQAILSPLTAQIITGTILGTVADTSGAVLPSALITIRNTDTGFTRSSVTDHRGRYTEPQLPIGHYEVEAGLANFQTQIKRNL